ncbi:MAG: ABC transporter permease [Clostridia bacterium]|nr:ABC transporter permease [Clostridia bacterium]
MSTVHALIRRNTKLFFKDKGMFFTSLITPMILLVLYATFLGNVYRDSFLMSFPPQLAVSDRVIDALVGGQLISSILAVSCVTVAFCSNFLMVQDRANGTARDLTISPVSAPALSVSYYIASLLATLIICLAAAAVCFVYIAVIGWYLSVLDVVLILADVVLLVLFGTALSSIVNFFLSSQGQISAVGSIVSAGYGFVCGAYMPISQFSEGLQRAVSFFPGTYATSLLRNHALDGAFEALADEGIPAQAIDAMRATVDCDISFFDHAVGEGAMFVILGISAAALTGVYILMNTLKSKKHG